MRGGLQRGVAAPVAPALRAGATAPIVERQVGTMFEDVNTAALAKAFALAGEALNYPDAEFAARVACGAWRREAFSALTCVFVMDEEPAEFAALGAYEGAEAPEPAVLDRLRIAYTNTFLNVPEPRVALQESQFCAASEGMETIAFINPVAQDVRAAYKRAGLKVAPGSNEPSDTVFAECEFLAYLCACEDAEMSDIRDKFFVAHFASWVGRLAAAIREATDEPLYVAAAMLLDALVAAGE